MCFKMLGVKLYDPLLLIERLETNFSNYDSTVGFFRNFDSFSKSQQERYEMRNSLEIKSVKKKIAAMRRKILRSFWEML